MKGSCLCGAVTYEVNGLGPIGHCHCKTCRKAHAARYTSTARARRSDFRWLQGQSQLRAFESTPGKLRHFCTLCGSHLMAEWRDQDQVIVRVATLDEDPAIRGRVHIWLSHEAPWLVDDVPTQTHQEGLPARK